MDIVYILQVITICVTVVTLVVNVLITSITNKQKNYNEIITSSRLDFMKSNRDKAANFAAEAKNIAFMLKCENYVIDVKPLYTYFEQLNIALKTYNSIDNEIITTANCIIEIIEKSVIDKKYYEDLLGVINKFSNLMNIYDDADWKFIKQQFNSTSKKSEDFDAICDIIKTRYRN